MVVASLFGIIQYTNITATGYEKDTTLVPRPIIFCCLFVSWIEHTRFAQGDGLVLLRPILGATSEKRER